MGNDLSSSAALGGGDAPFEYDEMVGTDGDPTTGAVSTEFGPDTTWSRHEGKLPVSKKRDLARDYLQDASLRLNQIEQALRQLKMKLYSMSSSTSRSDSDSRISGDDTEESHDPQEQQEQSGNESEQEQERRTILNAMDYLQQLSADITLTRDDVQEMMDLQQHGDRPVVLVKRKKTSSTTASLYSLIRKGVKQLPSEDEFQRQVQIILDDS